MNSSLVSADRITYLKVVSLALVSNCIVLLVVATLAGQITSKKAVATEPAIAPVQAVFAVAL